MSIEQQLRQPLWPHLITTTLAALACGVGVYAYIDGATPQHGDELQQLFGVFYMVDFAPALLLALAGLATRRIGFSVASFLLLLFGAMGGPLLTWIMVLSFWR